MKNKKIDKIIIVLKVDKGCNDAFRRKKIHSDAPL